LKPRGTSGLAWGIKEVNHRSCFLELTSESQFFPKAFPESDIMIIQANASDPNLGKHLWGEVGRGFWNERENWTLERWHTHLSEKTVTFWIAKNCTEELGFFELRRNFDSIKIEGFGLLKQWRHRGLVGGLLSAATQKAFECGANHVWLHTATDDHPNALPNYKKRVYRIYLEDVLKNPMPKN
jgi:ribosomal protein S18 acetylase RimI-like enzyme